MLTFQLSLIASALEHAGFGLCIVDSSGRIVLINEAFTSKIEIESAAVLGLNYRALFGALGKMPDFDRLFDMRQGGLSQECMIHLKDGSFRYVLFQTKNFPHESGEVFRSVSAMDVTDYGVTRDRFVDLHRQMESMNNAVVIVNAQAPDYPIVFVNSHFERMTGYAKHETIGRNCRFLQGAECDQPALTQLREAIRLGKNCQVSLKNFRKDGSVFQNELFVSPLFDERGTLTHFIGVQHEGHVKVLRPRASHTHKD